MFLQRAWLIGRLIERISRCCVFAGLVGLAASSPSFAAKFQWEPIPDTELASREPSSSPDAHGEILFSRHALNGDVTENYVRAKVYTKKGVDLVSVLSIDH